MGRAPEERKKSPSDLFAVRLWSERADGTVEWRGKVQHLPSGEARYFREWTALVEFMLDVVTKLTDSRGAHGRRRGEMKSSSQ